MCTDYEVSKQIINGNSNNFFKLAYSPFNGLDFSSKKQSLKEFEAKLGIVHRELILPWNCEALC